jgi:hypothetical protein
MPGLMYKTLDREGEWKGMPHRDPICLAIISGGALASGEVLLWEKKREKRRRMPVLFEGRAIERVLAN